MKYKLMAILIPIPLIGLLIHFSMSVDIFKQDKLTFILNSARNQSKILANQISVEISLAKRFAALLGDHFDQKKNSLNEIPAKRIFLSNDKYLFFQIYKKISGGKYQVVARLQKRKHIAKYAGAISKGVNTLVDTIETEGIAITIPSHSEKIAAIYFKNKKRGNYIFVMAFKISRLTESFSNSSLTGGFLVDQSGQILLGERGTLYKNLPENFKEWNVFKKIVTGEFKQNVLKIDINDGQMLFAAFSKVSSENMFVLSFIDEEIAFSGMNTFIIKSILLILAVICVLVFMAFFISLWLEKRPVVSNDDKTNKPVVTKPNPKAKVKPDFVPKSKRPKLELELKEEKKKEKPKSRPEPDIPVFVPTPASGPVPFPFPNEEDITVMKNLNDDSLPPKPEEEKKEQEQENDDQMPMPPQLNTINQAGEVKEMEVEKEIEIEMAPPPAIEPVAPIVVESSSNQKIRNFFKVHSQSIQKISKKLGITVAPLKIIGGDIELDEEKYSDLFASMIHVFRFSLFHGIEEAKERSLNSKPASGNICVTISKIKISGKRCLSIVLSDDGKGIDSAGIRAMMMRTQMAEMISKENDEQILQHFFDVGFATKSRIVDKSGKKYGLNVVKEVAEKMGGIAQISSKSGEGTSILITIPIN